MTPPDFSNKTLFGVQNDGLRYLWTGWILVILLLSLIGNITILVASLKYRAIKLHKVIVTYIEHIAVFDLITTLTMHLPKCVSLFSNEWVLGRMLCYYIVYSGYYVHCTNLLYISALTTCKWLILSYPLSAKTWFNKRLHSYICITISVLSSCIPIAFLVVDKYDVSIDYRTYVCAYRYTAEIWQWLRIVFSSILGFIPLVNIVVMSSLLVKHLLKAKKAAKRSRASFRWQGLVTVLLTTTVYLLSYLPFATYLITENLMERASSSSASSSVSSASSPLNPLYYRLVKEMMKLSVVYNVFVYAFTVKSFGEFLKGEFRQRLSAATLSGFSTVSGDSFKSFPSSSFRQREHS